MTPRQRPSFERASRLYPQPVAISCCRIEHAAQPQDRLAAVIKCGEVLTRYLCAAALASFAARDDLSAMLPDDIRTRLHGPLSWGTFLAVVQAVAALPAEHPLRGPLAQAFVAQGDRPAAADEALVKLLELRNDVSHDLQAMTAPQAAAILTARRPDALLYEALSATHSLLSLPLFVFELQYFRAGQARARRLLLMGESGDPAPDDIAIDGCLTHDDAPYIAVKGGAVPLAPWLVRRYLPAAGHDALYILDRIEEKSLSYQPLGGEDVSLNGDLLRRVEAIMAGEAVPVEQVRLADGTTLTAEWKHLSDSLLPQQPIPWDTFDEDTVNWYAARLGVKPASARTAIQERLIDGRNRLNPDDIAQLTLLFGTDESVRHTLHRPVLDLRIRSSGSPRWDARLECEQNIFRCLGAALEFLREHLDLDEATLDNLDTTGGTADYIAVREAIVNAFLHQDYNDASAPAQIDLEAERCTFFNPGHALVAAARLIEGGVSHSRNPIIARAFRLIHFAELAGTGLRMVHHAWREEHRRPPSIASDPEHNSFTLVLDWHRLLDVSDTFWRERLGVKVSPEEALALSLAADAGGATPEEIASAAAITVAAARHVSDDLCKKALVYERDGRIFIQRHLQEVADQARLIQWVSGLLKERPRTFDELLPLFAGHVKGQLTADEAREELKGILAHFLEYRGGEPVPRQIARALAEGQVPYDGAAHEGLWYVPDRESAEDRARLHEADLLRDFEAFRQSPGRRDISLEALRAGFRDAWQRHDYRTIVAVGEHVREELLERDAQVLNWFDQAQVRARQSRT
ncbi:MAG TPA: ATP-binding protein [Chloroflexota bacterium]|nr:ATP-binding protein [Chloroflexota bacterium]